MKILIIILAFLMQGILSAQQENRTSNREGELLSVDNKENRVAVKETGDKYFKLGSEYFQQGNYSSSFENFSKALDYYELIQQKTEAAAAAEQLGNLKLFNSNYHGAFEYQSKANLYYTEMKNDTGIVNTLNKMGLSQLFLKKFDKAFNYFRESKELSSKIDYKTGYGIALLNIGEYYFNVNNLDSAQIYYLEAKEISIQINDTANLVRVYTELGNLYLKKGNFALARDNYNEVLKISKLKNDDNINAGINYYLGLLYKSEKDYPKALSFIEQSLEISLKRNIIFLIRDNYLELSEIYRNFGDYKVAYNYYIQYSHLKDSLASIEKSEIITELSTKYDVEKKDRLIREYQLDEQRTTIFAILGVTIFLILIVVVLIRQFIQKKESVQFIQIAMDSISQPFIIINANSYKIEFINKAAISQNINYQLYVKNNKKKPAICFKTMSIYDKPCFEFGEKCPIEEIKKTKSLYKAAKSIKNDDGSFKHLEINAYPYLNKKGEIEKIIYYENDLTEITLFQESLIAAKTDLEKNDRLKSRILANLTHETRTPLNIITGCSTILRSEIVKPGTNEMKTILESLDEGMKRLIQAIESIIELSNLESGNYEPRYEDIDLNFILIQVYDSFQKYANDKGLKYFYVQDVQYSVVYGDMSSIYNLFTVFVSNAVKFTDNGEVLISLSYLDEERIVVKIKDTGVGINDEYIDKLYQPFSQEDMSATRSYEGLGIGLALAKRYCELNGIEVNINSQKNTGTEIILTFHLKI